MSFNIKDIIFWIVLAIGIGLLAWNIFGHSPTEFITLITLIFAILLKMWSISDKQIKMEMIFKYLSKDFKEHLKK